MKHHSLQLLAIYLLSFLLLFTIIISEAKAANTQIDPEANRATAASSQHSATKYNELPPIFKISVEEEERFLGDKESFVHKEWLTTTNTNVNAEIKGLVDQYDASLSPTLKRVLKQRGKKDSTLNIDVVYYRTGEQWLSTMVLARVNDLNVQQTVNMSTGTYDLKTGEHVTLLDLFGNNAGAWDMLAAAVHTQMLAVFPGEERDLMAIDRLCSREALEKADFSLSGMELTLHYLASEIISGKPTLLHVHFLYPELWNLMTAKGRAVTDNSRWKMIAITCDDGPKDTPSTLALNAFRKVSARVTYFIAGKQLERYGYVLQREFDQNHQIATHTFHHWGGRTFKKDQGRLNELKLSADWTYSLIGEAATLFRAPGGTYPAWVDTGMPMPIIQWSLDTHDYLGKSPKQIFYSFRNNIQDGDIVLCHDTGKYLHEAVPLFGKWLTEHGFMMVTVNELASYAGVEMMNNVVYTYFGDNR